MYIPATEFYHSLSNSVIPTPWSEDKLIVDSNECPLFSNENWQKQHTQTEL